MGMDWSAELDAYGDELSLWAEPGSNLLLDFHGDPSSAGLVILSDGNHHMALKEVVVHFCNRTPELRGVFYATTPPGPIVTLLRKGCIRLGNFVLSTRPHVFMGPPQILEKLVADGYLDRQHPFVRNQGNVLLVRKGNPRQIQGVHDLKRDGITLFLSNPETETASYHSYRQTLVNLLADAAAPAAAPAADSAAASAPSSARGLEGLKIIYGRCIHHREAPDALLDGRADAAVLFYHLGLYFTRRFPQAFEMLPLGGSVDQPPPPDGNPIGYTHAGIIGDGGPFGAAFIDFLMTEAAGAVYRHHGLVPLSNS